jgi:hypothetical protein
MVSSTVDRLKKKSTKVVKIKEEGETEPYEFIIQRLSTFELIESQAVEDTIDENTDLDNMEVKEENTLKSLKKGVFPLMKKFIPICCVSPKIIFEGEPEGDDVLHHRQIPMTVLTELFNQILMFSGLDKASMEKIKKKQQEQSSKT